MKRLNRQKRPSVGAFTMIELLIVITIIAILAGILMPVTQNIITRARDQQCANNLRQIGVAANAAATDNDNTYPIIEIDGNNQPVANTLNVPAKNLVDALSPYGVTAVTFQCPADLRGPNNYASQNPHSSYMWSPYSEDTSQNVPTIYRRRGQTSILPSHLQLASDWSPVHMAYDSNVGAGNMIYVLYGDGHVKTTRRKPVSH